jgi:hypothetical protein
MNPAYSRFSLPALPSILFMIVSGVTFDGRIFLCVITVSLYFTAGDYSIRPSNLFTYVDTDGTPKNLYATVEDVGTIKLSGNLAVSRVHDKRANFDSCSQNQQLTLAAAAATAKSLAFNAYAYLLGISSTTYWYGLWYGRYDASRKATSENLEICFFVLDRTFSLGKCNH